MSPPACSWPRGAKAVSISSSVRAFRTGSWTPFMRAASCINFTYHSLELSGFISRAITVAWGTSSQKELKPLGLHLSGEVAEAGEVAARPGETGDEACPD